MLTTSILELAKAVILVATEQQRVITTAESCTGGLVAAALTAVPGSSAVLDCGLVSYSNEAKIELLAVPALVIAESGAVSPECALAMAKGALSNSRADIVVSITGIAGPGGGTENKPVGYVCFCAIGPNGIRQVEHRFGDLGRETVREKSVITALELMLEQLRP